MDNLRADTERIRRCADELKRIHGEFTTHGNPADQYGARELGSSLITDAFEEFGDNWKINRRQLAAELTILGKITEEAARTYTRVDTALANALREQDGVADRGHGASRR